jgi:hypothetical protein
LSLRLADLARSQAARAASEEAVMIFGQLGYWILRSLRASVPLSGEPPFRGWVSHHDAVG